MGKKATISHPDHHMRLRVKNIFYDDSEISKTLKHTAMSCSLINVWF